MPYLEGVSKKDLKAALGAAGLSQLAAGRLFHVDGRTVRKWVAGDAPVPGAVWLALELMIRLEVTPDQAAEWMEGKR